MPQILSRVYIMSAQVVQQLLAHLTQPETRRRIAEETEANMGNSWADLLIASVADQTQQALVGQTIQQVADARGCAGNEAGLDLLIENQGALRIISFNQSEENLRKVLTHPLTSIITDGLITAGKPHPRTFGTYPTFFGQFVREKGWFTLAEGVHKATGLPAGRFQLAGRGVIQSGNWADITIFAADKIGTKLYSLNPFSKFSE